MSHIEPSLCEMSDHSGEKPTLANKKTKCGVHEREDLFKTLGCKRAFEDEMFKLELNHLGLRHNSFIRSLCFDLESSIRLFSQNGVSYPVCSNIIYKKSQKMGNSFPDERTRKKFLQDCRQFGTLTYPKATSVLRKLTEVYAIEDLIGYRKKGFGFLCFRDFSRVKHILGLSDAVDQAMSNFGITISFPSYKTALISSPDCRPSRSRVFSHVRNDPSKGPQLEFRFQRRSLRTRTRRLDLILHYLREFPKHKEEKEYVKIIKLSLAGTFSKQMDQDLPEGYPEKGINLFPEVTQRKLDSVLGGKNCKDKRVQFYFNILQSKGLCSPVGDDMIQEQYQKHFDSLCRPEEETIPRDDELYQKLFAYGCSVGESIDYDPFTTKFPNAMSSIEKNRLEGGNRKALHDSGSLKKFNRHPILGLSEGQVRLEPYVIGLFGPPGSGKTTLVNQLVQELRYHLAPEMDREEFLYSRSCSTSHWDGYNHQPVVVLDDFGQNLETRSDISEFMTLISINDYVLPMAELSEKGRKFTSPIVIVTSNMSFGSHVVASANSNVIEDPIALWRRFDLPLLIEKGSLCHKYQFDLFKDQGPFYAKKHRAEPGTSGYFGGIPTSGRNAPPKSLPTFCKIPKWEISSICLKELRKKFDFHRYTFHDSWTQKISSVHISYEKFTEGPIWDPDIREVSEESCYPNARRVYLDFPAYPPAYSPIVKASAIPEPLKVRMITIAESDTKVLQPLQMSLWRYLSTKPQFCLTNGVKELEDFVEETLPWIYRIEEVIKRIAKRGDFLEKPVWLSGDYTAATDNFPMWVTEALVEGILSKIDHEPTKRWVRWEISSHEMRYPRGRTGSQTSGQLMGSLLSFPLLCFLNDFVMQESGFDPLSYLVNGDDVVAFSERKEIDQWKELAPRVGLSLSIGKNFIDPDFCTVNSQLFFRGEVRHTGKVNCQTRVGQTIGYTFQEAQFYWGTTPEIKENFLIRNWTELKKTPRSLHFSTKHGGLGIQDTHEGLELDMGLHKRVYFYDCLHRFSVVHPVEGAPFTFVPIPLLRGSEARKQEGKHPSQVTFEKFQSLIDPSERKKTKGNDLSHHDLREFDRKIERIIGPRHAVIEGKFHLHNAPDCDWLEVAYLPITNGLAKRVSEQSLRSAYDWICEEWIEKSFSSPFEYKDHMDVLEEYPDPIWEDYSHESLDMVQLFRESPPTSEEGERLRKDVLDFWNPIERLESLDGGKFFVPRPQGFEALDEFLNIFDKEHTLEEFLLLDEKE